MSEKHIRVRFAPSPTGPLHMGGVRTALFNYLFAKKNGGDFILRIEDTDQNRYVTGAEEYIIESLKWCSIEFNEGVGIGGPHAPYRQSERKEIYRQYAERLVISGNAYYAFDTAEELENMRKKLEAEKAHNTSYCAATRMTMRNSFTLPQTETQTLIRSGHPFVIRFTMPADKEVTFHDLIRQSVTVNSSTLDDKVLFKSDGMPTYHLANVVDDYLMKISHVIRGEEWLPSAPLHVLLYKALGWESDMPQFAHLPLLLKPDGKGKLSKRDGDRLGFPVFPIQWKDTATGEIFSGYRESGYFPGAFVNILALLGWNPGTEQEILSMDELVQLFSLDKVQKAGARFDPEKAKWFNQQYMKALSSEEITTLLMPMIEELKINVCHDYVKKVVDAIRDRTVFLKDFIYNARYFYSSPEEYDAQLVAKKWNSVTPGLLKSIAGVMEQLEDFTASNLETKVKEWLESNGIGAGQAMNALRLAMVGSNNGPGIFLIMEIIGKEETLIRIENALNRLM
ncbi:MAG: glutamate--tRNA ligase [Bacteroidia bacterium]|nr:glutamate--tRNA ligase [Bacteroidia bacterium]